jgi:hypothetical protein
MPDGTPAWHSQPWTGVTTTDLRSPGSLLTFDGKVVRVAVQRSAATGAQLLFMDGLRRLADGAQRGRRTEDEFVADVQALAMRLGLVANVTATSETAIAVSLAAAPRIPLADK